MNKMIELEKLTDLKELDWSTLYNMYTECLNSGYINSIPVFMEQKHKTDYTSTYAVEINFWNLYKKELIDNLKNKYNK